MTKAVPMVCLVCKHQGSYYGRLVFPQELEPDEAGVVTEPECPNHTGSDLTFPLTPVNNIASA